MSTQGKKCLPPLVDHVISTRKEWKDSTSETARTDAQRVLEALLVDIGIDGALAAMDRQGFASDSYASLIRTLHKEAASRRIQRG